MSKDAAGIIAAILVGLALFGAAFSVLQFFGFGWSTDGLEIAQKTRVRADIAQIRTCLVMYRSENGAYPSTAQGLFALVARPAGSPVPTHWTQRLSGKPKDPWNNDYIYRCPGNVHSTDYDLFSPGPDHKPDTLDDDWAD